jgi:hypothetical protein
VERRLLLADGVERATDSSGCRGVEAAEASSDGQRVFTRSTLSCEGGAERTTRGIIAMVSPDQWIDVRALMMDHGSVSWVKRYRAAPASRVKAAALTDAERARLERVSSRDMAMETARMVASSAPSVEQVIDAHARTDAEAVRAWIAEQNAPIRLDADKLLRLADAGVSGEVIDVLVAVSHPEKFATGREPDMVIGQGRGDYGYNSYTPLMLDPFYYNPYYYGSQYYRYGMGYNTWFRQYGGPGVIVVRPVTPEGRRPGQMVKGQGYTTGADAASAPRAVRRGSGGNSAARATVPAASSSGTKAQARPKPKAKPKGGG